jgi:predicted RecA/RadA family phage recombinase
VTTSYVQRGNAITYSNAGSAIAAGDVVVMGHTIGVALADIAATTGTGPVAVEGVFTVPKVSAAEFAQGEKLVWDATEGAFDDSAAVAESGDITGAAIAMAAGSNGETTAAVKLTPGNPLLTP